MQEKRPRHYAQDIMNLDSKEERAQLFETVPDNFKPIVRRHCEIMQMRLNWARKQQGKQ